MGLTGERDHLSGEEARARLARAGQPLNLGVAEDTSGSELRQHLLPLLVAPPDAKLLAAAADRLGSAHAEETQQTFVHVDPAGVGQPPDGHWRRVRLESAAELRFGHAQRLVRRAPGGNI